jgi:hypothetical protein
MSWPKCPLRCRVQGRVWSSRALAIKTLSEKLLEKPTSGYMPTHPPRAPRNGTLFCERGRVPLWSVKRPGRIRTCPEANSQQWSFSDRRVMRASGPALPRKLARSLPSAPSRGQNRIAGNACKVRDSQPSSLRPGLRCRIPALGFLIQVTSSSLVSCSRSASMSMHHADYLIHDIRKRSGARYGCFSLGSGFITASTAAVGSSSTPKRPMPGMSSGPTRILAPSFLARAIVASTSSTAT